MELLVALIKVVLVVGFVVALIAMPFFVWGIYNILNDIRGRMRRIQVLLVDIK